jgi:hypothetical protein
MAYGENSKRKKMPFFREGGEGVEGETDFREMRMEKKKEGTSKYLVV